MSWASYSAPSVLSVQARQDLRKQHQVATGILQLCAVSSLPLFSVELTAVGEFACASPSRPDSGSENHFLVKKLVELGAVPNLLRLHSLCYSRPLREGARRVLRPLLRLHGDAVRTAARDVIIPQPVGTSPADWIEWRQQFEQDMYGDVALAGVT